MADTIVIVGLEASDDYTTLAAALAAVPSDLTILTDNYRIQLRSDQTHPRMTLPTVSTDATHRLILEAFPSNETDGTGSGSTIESNSGLGVIRGNSNTNYFDLKGLYVNQTGTSRCVLLNGSHFSFYDCLLKSTSGDTIETSNAQGRESTIDNVILVNTGGGLCLDWSTGGDNLTRTINRVTGIGGTTRTFDRGGSTEAQRRVELYTNCLAFPNTGGQSWPTLSSAFRIFESDFNAASDGLGTVNSLTTGFNNRVITTDLADPNGATPNYNLSPSSTLNTAGSDGGRIGAFLGASNQPESLSLDVGSFTLTGSPISTQIITPINNGTFSMSGTAIGTMLSIVMSGGSFSLSGGAINQAIINNIDSGSFLLSGTPVNILVSNTLEGGSFSLTGTNINFSVITDAESITLESGSFELTGTPITTQVISRIDSGSYEMTGNPITLIYSGDPSRIIGKVTARFADGYTANYVASTITVKFGE